METAFAAFRGYENWAPRPLFNLLRRAGMAFALEYCEAEDGATNYIDIGPVNKVRILTCMTSPLLRVYWTHVTGAAGGDECNPRVMLMA